MVTIANPAAAFMQGQQFASQAEEMKQQNALRDLYRSQGAAIAEGDPQALNALAGIDPMAARGIRRENQADQRADAQFGMAKESHGMQMQVSRQNLEQSREQGRRAAEQHAAQMDEFTRQREAEEIGRAVGAASMAYGQGPEAFEAWKQQNAQMIQEADLDPAGVTYETFPQIAAGLLGAKEALEGIAAGQSLNRDGFDPDRYKVAGGTIFDLQAPGGPAPVGQGQGQETVVMGPDGQPVYIQGPAGTSGKFTESQSKDNVYSTRARGALEVLEPVAPALSDRGERAAEAIPFGLARGFQSDDFQVAQQAGTEFLQAILRKDTGAAITQDEVESYGRTYLPAPGDSEAVQEAKRQARYRALAAIEAGMQPAQMLARDRALIMSATEAAQAPEAPQSSGGSRSSRQPSEQQGGNPFAGITPEEFSQIDIGSLTPEQIDQLFEAYQK